MIRAAEQIHKTDSPIVPVVEEIRRTDSRSAGAPTSHTSVLPVTDDKGDTSKLVSQLAEEVKRQRIDTNPNKDELSRRLQQGIDGLRVLR